jgi:serine/threonine protein kinase
MATFKKNMKQHDHYDGTEPQHPSRSRLSDPVFVFTTKHHRRQAVQDHSHNSDHAAPPNLLHSSFKSSKYDGKPPLLKGFELTHLVGKGAFGVVFGCRCKTTGRLACAKLEPRDAPELQLALECSMYAALSKTTAKKYIPEIICSGVSGDYNFMVMELGGKDISNVGKSVSVASKLRICISLLNAIEAFHKAGFLHRDIKPKNIILRPPTSSSSSGFEASNEIMLVDLGLSKRYIQPDGRHHKNRFKNAFVGTSTYCSPYSQMYTEASRRDDMYSMCYTMCTLFMQVLPWQAVNKDPAAFGYSEYNYSSALNISYDCTNDDADDDEFGRNDNRERRARACKSEQKRRIELQLKRYCTPAQVCGSRCPPSVAQIYAHVMQLHFDETPPYALFRDLINADLAKFAVAQPLTSNQSKSSENKSSENKSSGSKSSGSKSSGSKSSGSKSSGSKSSGSKSSGSKSSGSKSSGIKFTGSRSSGIKLTSHQSKSSENKSSHSAHKHR